MPSTAAQLVTDACQIAQVKGMTAQAGRVLNRILIELTQEYDLMVALRNATVQITGGAANNGAGPYDLPADYLRMAPRGATFLVGSVPRILVQISLTQFFSLINVTGIADYPANFASDVLRDPPGLYVYPPPEVAFPLTIFYYGTMPEIQTPETSTEYPWFPAEHYLLVRLAGEMMRLAGDPRAESFLGEGPTGAVGILRRWLNLQGDREDSPMHVELDGRYFGTGGRFFPPSKVTAGM